MQIGPRIRVGGTLGRFGDKVKKVGGKLARNPLVQAGLGFATGGATIPFLVGAAGGALKEHAGIGDVVKGGIQGGAAGYGGDKLRGGFSALKSAAASPLDKLPTAIPDVSTIGAPAANVASAAPAAAKSLLGTAKSALSSVGSFAQKNPTAAAMALQGAGALASAGSENRINEAQADILEQRADETAYDFEQRKRREQALQGLWSPLGTAIGGNYSQVATNPYLPRVG